MAIDGNLRGTLSAQAGLNGTTSIADFVTEAELETALENYAEELEENGTAAYAKELISDEKVNSQTPYYFRPTAEGNIKVDSRAEINAIVGASAVVNQLFLPMASKTQNGVTITNNGDGTYTMNGTSTGRVQISQEQSPKPSIGASNKVLAYIEPISGTVSGNGQMFMCLDNNDGTTTYPAISLIGKNGGIIINAQSAKIRYCALDYQNSGSVFTNYRVKPKFVNLTKFFGSATIADYLCSLEQATAGSGIAKLKSWGFDFSNLPYTANSLQSVSGLSAKKTTGLNQWDEQWELGLIDTNTGQNVSGTTTIRSKGYVEVVPSSTYYGRATAQYTIIYFFYDANKNFISSLTTYTNRTFAIPSNACYLRFRLETGYGTTYKNDICIFIHHDSSMDGTYEPYWERTYPLDESLTLRGIYKLDSSNNLYADGDEYKPSGEVKRKRGRMNLGEQNWTYYTSGTNPIFYLSVHTADAKVYSRGDTVEVVCQNYPVGLTATARSNIAGSTGLPDKSCTWMEGSDGKFVIRDSSYTDVASFKTAMANVYMEYELATPTTETATPYTNPQIVDSWGTEEFVTTSPIPIGHDTDYPISLKDKIESFPDLPTANGTYLLKIINGVASWVAHS